MSESTKKSGKRYRTVTDTALREGVSTNPSQSSFICNIAAGTEVLVTHAQGRRAYIVQPQEGWVSLQKSNGDVILKPVDDTMLVKKNLITKIEQKGRRVPQEAYNKSYMWDATRQGLKSVLIANDIIEMSTVSAITGISITNSKVIPGQACIALFTMSFPDLKEIHSRKEVVRLTNRAIDGYACFREEDALNQLFQRLLNSNSFDQYRKFLEQEKNLKNQIHVVMINRNGIFDKEGFGLASLFGTRFKVPTIGIVTKCTKHRYVHNALGSTEQLFVPNPAFEGETALTQAEVVEQLGDRLRETDCVDIKRDGDVLCSVLKLRSDRDPVYVSVGHGCSLQTAVELCRKSSVVNIPEPLRRATLETESTMQDLDAKSQLLEKMRASPAVTPMSAEFGGVYVKEV